MVVSLLLVGFRSNSLVIIKNLRFNVINSSPASKATGFTSIGGKILVHKIGMHTES